MDALLKGTMDILLKGSRGEPSFLCVGWLFFNGCAVMSSISTGVLYRLSPPECAAAPPKPALRMDDLHAAILSWDLRKDVLLPSSAAPSLGLPQSAQLPPKPGSFSSMQQYADAF
eukprot:scaffold167265_cov17-Tisochrysis_lutea.AAC.1